MKINRPIAAGAPALFAACTGAPAAHLTVAMRMPPRRRDRPGDMRVF